MHYLPRKGCGVPWGWNNAMADYKVYFVDWTGHFLDRVDIECADDQSAIARATEISHGTEVEVWCSDRRVAVLNEDRFRKG
jgi:hypothetical protein